MRRRVGLLAVAASFAGAAAAQTAAPQPKGAQAAAALEACSARKFETTVRFTGANGKPRQSNVKLCGKPGQTDAEWAVTLRDAARKVQANTAMPAEARQQIADALSAELAKLEPASVTTAPALANAPPLPAPRKAAPLATTLPEYSVLPPLPAPTPARPAGVVGSAGAAVAAAPYVPPLPRPRLSFSCFSAGDIGANGPCFDFDRDTLITVKAGEPLKNTSLRFVRSGAVRADYPLPPLAQGRSARFALPRAVCANATGGTLTIRIVRAPAGRPDAAQVVGTEGPYNLRC